MLLQKSYEVGFVFIISESKSIIDRIISLLTHTSGDKITASH